MVIVFPNGSYLLYDDDCGICTKFSTVLGKLLYGRTKVLPMHLDEVLLVGMETIPEEYWTSFHIVKDGEWYTEGEAIVELSRLFPFGNILSSITSFPPVHITLMFILRLMQRIRSSQCKADFVIKN